MLIPKSKGTERRADDRHAVDLPATVRAHRWGPYETRIMDVSAGGAMIALPAGLARRGSEIALIASGIEMVATVAWVTADYCGLAFSHRLTPGELAAWRHRAHTRTSKG